jgi:hypothetical protein
MKRLLLWGLGIAAIGASALSCSAPVDSEPKSASTHQGYDTDTSWPINSDCTCPDPSTISWQVQDECAMAQQMLNIFYDHGATWNGGTTMPQQPYPGNSGACADYNLPPLTYGGPYGYGDFLRTPTMNAPYAQGLYEAFVQYPSPGLMWQYGPTPAPGGYLQYQQAPFYLSIASHSFMTGDLIIEFEPTGCGGCWMKM